MAVSARALTDPTLNKPPRRRRWIPLSVRMFVGILAFLALLAALQIGFVVERYRRERAATDELVDREGYVEMDESGPAWIRPHVGHDLMKYFDVVVGVHFLDDVTVDDDLRVLHKLPDLKFLRLHSAQISDAGLEHLKGLVNLRSLELGNTRVTGSGLSRLQGLPKLQHLSLRAAHLTDDGIANLKRLKSLRELELRGDDVTDAHLNRLKKLPALASLCLDETGVADSGLAELADFPALTTVVFVRYPSGTPTDASVATLRAEAPQLTISIHQYGPSF